MEIVPTRNFRAYHWANYEIINSIIRNFELVIDRLRSKLKCPKEKQLVNFFRSTFSSQTVCSLDSHYSQTLFIHNVHLASMQMMCTL